MNPGSLGYATIVHEILHGLGLAHPHRDGGDVQVLQGVTSEFNAFGTFLYGFYRDFHPDARKLLDACDSTLKSALYEREPIPQWSRGCVTLLGDACHPMLPFMAQGACMAIEDAVVLGRALGPVTVRGLAPQALLDYCATRQERTARIQLGSRGNQWMKTQGNADWVYGYDAWSVPLGA